MPRFGLGTWRMGEKPAQRAAEAGALRLGVELGVTLIDTAEMYGNGVAEEIIGEALAAVRDRLFIVSKVLPENAGRQAAVKACERSLRRLRTDRLDLYLLHWPGQVPLSETVEAFEHLRSTGKIRHWGVSNFDTPQMDELASLPAGAHCQTNQILYNLARRGPERSLLPSLRKRAIPIMAYSPIEQGRLLKHRTLASIAGRHQATPAQVALAWLLRSPDVIVIPKASNLAHVREDIGALGLRLDSEDLAALEAAFPAPDDDSPLEVL